MQVQSLSIVVPGGCPNRCKFCVSVLHPSPMVNQIEKNKRFHDLYRNDYIRRLNFARDNGCNTVMLTGNGEPVLNESFLNSFSEWNEKLDKPFRWIEVQTSGVTLDEEKLRWLRNTVGVSMISLSLSDVFSSDKNAEYNQTPEKVKVDIEALCAEIKRYDFDLRLSLNMTRSYNDKTATDILNRCQQLGANQVTIRVLYASDGGETEINSWIRQNKCDPARISQFNEAIAGHPHPMSGRLTGGLGRPLRKLQFGGTLYSVMGMSVVIDDDCMSQKFHEDDTVKYLILQPNCKLYTQWDDEGSLLF